MKRVTTYTDEKIANLYGIAAVVRARPIDVDDGRVIVVEQREVPERD
jgi:hypothetical protein